MLFLVSNPVIADDIPLIPGKVRDAGSGGQFPKAPMAPLYITQDGYTLTIPVFEEDFILQLLDDSDAVVYTLYVPAGTSTILLPSTLTGNFQLRLVGSDYFYFGFINL